MSNLNKKIYATIEAWRNRPIEGDHPLRIPGRHRLEADLGGRGNVSLLVAIGVNAEGYGDILVIVEGAKEDNASWLNFLKHLKESGLTGARLIISDACLGLVDPAAEVFPQARWQRCVVHWYRNAFAKSPRTKVAQVALMLKANHASESRSAAEVTTQRVRASLDDMKLSKLGEWIAAAVGETLTYHQFPAKHWRKIRTNNALERLLREIRCRTRVVGVFLTARAR